MSILDPPSLSTPQADKRYIKSEDTIVPRIGAESSYARVITDANDRVLLGIKGDERGTVEAGFLEVSVEANLKRLNGVEVSTLPQASTGYAYVLMDKAKHIIMGVRTDGTVTIPLLDEVTSTQPQASTIAEAFRQSGSSETGQPIVSTKNVTLAGHSMLAGASSYIASALSGITVTNLSVGGESSRIIAGRQGGQPILFLPVGGLIPAAIQAIPITLSFESKETFTNWPLLQGASTYTGYLKVGSATIPGTFGITRDPNATQYVHSSGDVYTFTRTIAGTSDTSVVRPVSFYYNTAQDHRADIFVYWVGRNNISQPAQVVADVQAMIQWQSPLEKRFVIISDHNASNEASGSANYTNVSTINNNLRALYGRRFIDSRRYLIDYGLSDAGLTATTQDTTDIANDIVPSSLRADSIHLNAYGSTIIASLIKQRLQEFGWYA